MLLSNASLAQRHYLDSFFSDKLEPLLMMRKPFWRLENAFCCPASYRVIIVTPLSPDDVFTCPQWSADRSDHSCAYFPHSLSQQISQHIKKNEIYAYFICYMKSITFILDMLIHNIWNNALVKFGSDRTVQPKNIKWYILVCQTSGILLKTLCGRCIWGTRTWYYPCYKRSYLIHIKS